MIYDPPLRFESAAPPRRRRRHLLIPALAAAVLLGAGTGLLIRPGQPLSDTPGAPPGASPIPSAGMQIVPGPPSVPAGPPLEVLKPFAAKPLAAPPTIGAARPLARIAARTEATSIPASLQAETQPSFDCASAIGAAETLVCADPRLASADRRMARAWRRAVELGAPTWRLRRDQRDWMIAREAAARDAPDEVADLYDQRIRELEALSPPSP